MSVASFTSRDAIACRALACARSRSVLARTKPTTAVKAMTARTRITPTTCMARRRRRARSARMLAPRKSRPASLRSTRVTSRRWPCHHVGNRIRRFGPPDDGRSRIRTGPISAPVSTVALASWRPCNSAPSSRPLATQSLAAFSTTRRARRAVTCASISPLSGGQFTRNASCATATKVRSPSASVVSSRPAMKGLSWPVALGNSSRATCLFVGLPCSSMVTKLSNASMTSSRVAPVSVHASCKAESAWRSSAPRTPPVSR